jgi:hypothetical protein
LVGVGVACWVPGWIGVMRSMYAEIVASSGFFISLGLFDCG